MDVKMRVLKWLPVLIGVLVGGAQEPSVVINQGAVVGVKIYPESSRVPIDAFLGIPYAAAPLGRLRFAPPEKHKGWQRTLFAQDFAPSCLELPRATQPLGGGQDLTYLPTKQHSEDCLYLNIWTLEAGHGLGKLPVVIIFHSDWQTAAPIDLPGQDLAAEGVLVISANYRLNVFGFLCLGTPEARGNLGILDQYFVMLWVKENIERFGGDPEKVTLLGHSAGATSVLYHMVSPRTKALFSKAIMMSGNMGLIWKQADVLKASKLIASLLGCFFDLPKDMVQCLKEKPPEDILKAFRAQYQTGNWSEMMVPVVDNFLQQTDRYIPSSPLESLSSGNFHQIPILTGLTNLEASDSLERWQDLARQGYHQLRHYIDYTAIPNIMMMHQLNASPNAKQIKELIKWEYIDKVRDGDAWELLQELLALYSEAQYEAPYDKLLAYLVKTSQPLYVYKYQETGGVDLHGKQLNSTGAAHSSELPYLFGPTLFQQLTRRRLNSQEERLSKRLRVMWSEFVKFGYPMPPRQYDAWQPYTSLNKNIRELGSGGRPGGMRTASYWNQLLPRIANITQDREGRSALNLTPSEDDGNDTIRHAMYTLLGLVIALVALLVVCVILLKKTAKERQLARDFGTF